MLFYFSNMWSNSARISVPNVLLISSILRVFQNLNFTSVKMVPDALVIFAAVGFTVFLWLITDIIWELMMGLKAHVLPHLKSRHNDLATKYGSWAGNCEFLWSFIFLRYFSYFVYVAWECFHSENRYFEIISHSWSRRKRIGNYWKFNTKS